MLTKNGSTERNSTEISPTDEIAARSISAALGNLPLALDVIGSYIASTGVRIHHFLQNHPRFQQDFIFSNTSQHRWTAQTYQRPINATFTMKIKDMDESAQLLMDLLAVLDPSGVPTELFEGRETESKLAKPNHAPLENAKDV